MSRVYDNGYELLGSVCDIKDYICRNCDDYEEIRELVEELENYDEDSIVVIDYDCGMGAIIRYCWLDSHKVIKEIK